jgi:Zn-dependent peptidase ImmA (M78 family)
MAAKRSPITPSVLGWALGEDGRSRSEIAEAIGVEEAILDAWLHDEERPSVGQVTRLADALRRPRALFFLPAPPQASSLPASFRHPPGDDRTVSATARRAVRRARRMQAVIAEALADEPSVDIPRFTMSVPPSEAGAQARDWLRISDEEQAAWRDDRDALRSWRDALDSRGIFVFALEIGTRKRQEHASNLVDDEIRGFSAWDPHAPLIVMNAQRVSPAARSFTLGHELGHLVTGVDAACVDSSSDVPSSEPVERWCEEFAAALLMPEARVRSLLGSRAIRGAVGWVEDVQAVARGFRVSHRAAALRMIDLGLARPGLYPTVESIFRVVPTSTPEARKIASPPRAVLRLRQYGTRALDTVLREVEPFEALSILNMTVPDARELAEQVPSAAIL